MNVLSVIYLPLCLFISLLLSHLCLGQFLLDAGATIEEQNESGHTALMEAASAGHIGVAKLLLSRGASINTHSNEFKESALTLAAYKGAQTITSIFQ